MKGSKIVRIGKWFSICRKERSSPQVPQAGSMFCLYFNENRVTNFDEAISSKHENSIPSANIDKGIYLPPLPMKLAL